MTYDPLLEGAEKRVKSLHGKLLADEIELVRECKRLLRRRKTLSRNLTTVENRLKTIDYQLASIKQYFNVLGGESESENSRDSGGSDSGGSGETKT